MCHKTHTPVHAAKWRHSDTSRDFGSGVQSRRHKATGSEARKIDQQLFQDAAILTGIGMGTAFVLLVVLVVVIVSLGRVSAVVERRFRNVNESGSPASSDDGALARDKALAAVVAVTALTSGSTPTTEGG